MKKLIACLLLGTLLGIISPLLSAQQNQNTQKSDLEIEALKKRVSELEKQLQIAENVEKINLQAKLAEANAKLADAEFGKFERKLKDSNDKWLREWSYWFLGVIGFFVVVGGVVISAVGGIFWFWLKSKTDSFIANEVEKSLNGFKEGLKELAILKKQLEVLEKERVVSVLERMYNPHGKDYPSSEEIKALREKTLLQVLNDEKDRMARRCKAAEVLAYQKKSPLLASPTLELVNSFLDSDMDSYPKSFGPRFIEFFRQVPTLEVHQGLTKFLNRLLAGKPEDKDLFLTQTISSLADVGVKLNIGDAVPILKTALRHLKDPDPAELEALGELARYFDIFNDPAGIKDILTNHVAGEMPNWESERIKIENQCLELLQKHDRAFVEKRRAEKTADNNDA